MLSNNENVKRYNFTDKTVVTLSFDFGFWDVADITVKATKTDGTLIDLVRKVNEGTVNPDFEVSSPSETGGTITRLSDWTLYDKITIIRTVAEKQEVDLVNGQPIDAPTLEKALDMLTAMCQQISEKLGRSFYFRIDEAGGDFEFPSKEQRKNALLGFDSTGLQFIGRSISQFDTDVQSAANNAQSASNSANSASASATSASNSATQAQGYLPVSKENIAIGASLWVDNEVTISVSEIKANSNVLVSPASNITDINSFATYGIYGKSNANGTLTLGCVTHPIAEVKINILIWG